MAMDGLRSGIPSDERAQQWICDDATRDVVTRAADAIAASHGIVVGLWRMRSWADMAREGVLLEDAWLQGVRPHVGSRFEQLLAPTAGPILALTFAPRAAPELLRAFVPPGRRYLSVQPSGVASIVQAALRLDSERYSTWAGLSVI